jgi:hypothetical protein
MDPLDMDERGDNAPPRNTELLCICQLAKVTGYSALDPKMSKKDADGKKAKEIAR